MAGGAKQAVAKAASAVMGGGGGGGPAEEDEVEGATKMEATEVIKADDGDEEMQHEVRRGRAKC